MNHPRRQAISDAATSLFLRQGYSRTQISHIAAAVGVSVGTIYHDFAGKQELMHFILKCAIDPDFSQRELERPITDSLFLGLEEELLTTFRRTAADFAENLRHMESYSFEALISDAFDLLSRYGVGCLFIEKNQADVPLLAGYYREYRKRFFDTMTRYIVRFMEQGTVRPLQHVELSTALIIEILTWWAMDARHIAYEPWNITVESAKEVCLDNIITAYKCCGKNDL